MKNQLIIIAIVATTAFLIGRASVKQTNETIYTQGKSVTGNVHVSLPAREIQPMEPILPYKYIFIDNTRTEIVDTAKIIQDYIAERSYSITLFNNLYGKLNIAPIIQYNKLTSVPFTFVPIEKTIYTQQKWTFFSTLSYNSFNIAGVGAGVFYKNRGVHYKYLWNTRLHVSGHEFGVNFLF